MNNYKSCAVSNVENRKTSPFLDLATWLYMVVVGCKFSYMLILSAPAQPLVLIAIGIFMVAMGATFRNARSLERSVRMERTREFAIMNLWLALGFVVAAFAEFSVPEYDEWMRFAFASLAFPLIVVMKSWVR